MTLEEYKNELTMKLQDRKEELLEYRLDLEEELEEAEKENMEIKKAIIEGRIKRTRGRLLEISRTLNTI